MEIPKVNPEKASITYHLINHIDDMIGGIVVIGCIVLLALHIDDTVSGILGASAGYFFGKGTKAVLK